MDDDRPCFLSFFDLIDRFENFVQNLLQMKIDRFLKIIDRFENCVQIPNILSV